MKIEQFNKPTCKSLRTAVEVKLQELAKEYGVNIKTGNGTFGDSYFNFKVEASTVNDNGTVMNKDAEEFKLFAHVYHLEPTDLGREFHFRGDIYKIRGLSSRSTKFPILAAKVSDGKTFKFPEDAVLKALGKPVVSNRIPVTNEV